MKDTLGSSELNMFYNKRKTAMKIPRCIEKSTLNIGTLTVSITFMISQWNNGPSCLTGRQWCQSVSVDLPS